MEPKPTRIPLRFKEFRLLDRVIRPDLNRIEHNGESVQVEPRVMDVLIYLSERAGEVISRDELLDRVWGETIVVEHVLTRAVSELRRILGDDTEQPRFIETIRKRGYRLVAPVVLPLAEASSDAGAPRRWGRWLWPIAAVVVVLLALLYWRGEPAPRHPVVLDVLPFTTYEGDERGAAFSPDGTRVAFTWDGPQGDNADIYVKQRDTETPLRLTTHPGYDAKPAWSPDGSTIAFARLHQQRVHIYTVPSIGGVERQLYEASSWIPGLDWAPDGRRLVFSERANQEAPYRLRVLDLDDLTAQDLTAPPGQLNDTDPAISPDGRSVAFMRQSLVSQQHLCLVPIDGGEARTISDPLLLVSGLAWRGGGRELIFTSAPSGPASLWSLSLESGAITPLIVRDTWVGNPSCPRQGRGLVYETWQCRSNIWRVELRDPSTHAGNDAPLGSEDAAPIIQSTRWDGHARFSPDRSHILFASARSGNSELWVCNADGSQALRLTSLGGQSLGPASWSPNGARICYSASPEGYAQVQIMDVAGGRPRAIVHGRHNDQACDWSPDGRWIYFASDRTGEWEIWKMTPDGADPIQVTQDGGLEAHASLDGRWIYYIKPTRGGLWRLRADGGLEECIHEGLSRRIRTNWCAHGDWIYFFDRDAEGSFVARYDTGTGEEVAVVRAPGFPGPGLHVAADGSALIYARTDDTATDLMLVDGFR